MPRHKKPSGFDGDRTVTHAELRALVTHLSAKFTAIEARLDECERVRPVNPEVKDAADALIERTRSDLGSAERLLTLVPDGATEEPAPEFDANGKSKDWRVIEASLPEVPLGIEDGAGASPDPSKAGDDVSAAVNSDPGDPSGLQS